MWIDLKLKSVLNLDKVEKKNPRFYQVFSENDFMQMLS